MRVRRHSSAIAAALCLAALGCTSSRTEADNVPSVLVGLTASSGAIGLSYHRAALTRELLVTMSTEGRPTPMIFESWEVSPDGLTWRLRIGRGVRFHDGLLLTAQLLAPHVAKELRGLSLSEVGEIAAESSDVLRITLKEPYAFLFEDLSVISALRVVDGQTISTGPYEVDEESPERLLLKATADFYRGAPDVSQIEVRLFPDQRNAWSALMRNEIDVLYEVSGDALQFVRSESSVSVTTFPRQYVYLFGFNVAHPVLANPDVRRALDRGVDRNALVRAAMSGEGEPAQGHVWPQHWAYDAAAGAIGYDPEEAIRMLDNAGLTVRIAPGRMPARLRLHCLVYEPLAEIALVLQRQLAQLDVDLQLEILPTSQLIGRLSTGDFDAFVFEMTATRGLKFPYQFWHSGTPFLKHGYSGADDVLDRIRHASNDGELKAAASAFQRRVHEDPPAVFLAWGRTSRAVSNRFEIPAGDDDIYHTISRWKLAPQAVRP